MSDEIARAFHEFINHDPKIRGHKIVHEVLQLLTNLQAALLSERAENAELRAKVDRLEDKLCEYIGNLAVAESSLEDAEEAAWDAAREPRKFGGPYGNNPYGLKYETIADWRKEREE